MTALQDARARVRTWLFDQALPLWAERGVDPDGRFYELLDFDARPVLGKRRTRVQARQVYLFAEAADLGFAPGRAIAQAGLDGMIRTCRRPDGLWVLSTDDAGAVIDDTPDLYDQAFCLFALAAGHRLLGDDRCRALAHQTLDAIETVMAAPHGGWAEAAPARLPRRQNPHMHLLEAMLAWRAATPDPRFARTAKVILALFEDAFFDEATGTLGEFFT
ncbi:MAG: N-acylglucosamine 2-epimerase, partial [Brevundimonas sp.]